MIKILSILLKPFEHDTPPATFDWLGDLEGRAEEPLHDVSKSVHVPEQRRQPISNLGGLATRFKA